MKKLAAMMLALFMVLASVGIAEEVPFSEWLAGQDPVVTDVFAGEAPAPEVPTPEAPAPEAPAFEPIGVGSRGETVAQLQAKLIELGILDGKADGIFGAASEAAVKYTQKALGWEETGVIQTADELNTILALVPGDGVNLAVGTSDEWSEWMMPEYNVENICNVIATAYPGDKQVGEPYTCQVEIEFADVTATGSEEQPFRFFAEGRADGEWEDWNKKNGWNRTLIDLSSTPQNGVIRCITTYKITEQGRETIQWDLGFRCDNWASGKYRVRRVKVEKGITATDWTPAKADIGDGVNLAVGTSDEWSEWMVPEYNVENICNVIATAYLGDKQIGELYTCQVEIEFADVTATGSEEQPFRFFAEGRADGEWEDWNKKNGWNRTLIDLSSTPPNGVIRCITTYKVTEQGRETIQWDLGFRCDNWASGKYRVRRVKVEKGATATDWTPAP